MFPGPSAPEGTYEQGQGLEKGPLGWSDDLRGIFPDVRLFLLFPPHLQFSPFRPLFTFSASSLACVCKSPRQTHFYESYLSLPSVAQSKIKMFASVLDLELWVVVGPVPAVCR